VTIIGIGTDIVDIRRIDNILAKKHADHFAKRILHPSELQKFNAHPQPASYLAKRFATKEAVSKALGTGMGRFVHFNEIETYHNEQGAPNVALHGETKAYGDKKGVGSVLVSLSDERHYALSYIILVA